MSVVCYECVVENGRVQLPAGVVLPDKTRVYVVVPGASPKPIAHIASPHLAHPEQAADFVLEVFPDETGAGP